MCWLCKSVGNTALLTLLKLGLNSVGVVVLLGRPNRNDFIIQVEIDACFCSLS